MLTYDRINIMLPSYKRHGRLRQFLDSAFVTAHDLKNVVVTVCVNAEDTRTLEAIKMWYWPCPHHVVIETTDQPNLSLYFNMMYEQTPFRAHGTLLTMFGDDMVFLTKGWDATFLEIMNYCNGKAIIFGDDDYIAHENLCVHMATSELLVDAAGKGKFMCPIYPAEMIDVVWYKFGLLTGTLRYVKDVHIRHEHDSALPNDKWDDTMRRLQPVRFGSNGETPRAAQHQQKVAELYATQMAGNAVSAGVCQWAAR